MSIQVKLSDLAAIAPNQLIVVEVDASGVFIDLPSGETDKRLVVWLDDRANHACGAVWQRPDSAMRFSPTESEKESLGNWTEDAPHCSECARLDLEVEVARDRQREAAEAF